MKSKYIYLLSSGHGTNTPGKRHTFSDGLEIFEYDVNRKILLKLIEKLDGAQVSYERINPEAVDVDNSTRASRANAIYKKNKNCIYLSIHNNAHSTEEAHGYELFTSRGKTKSDDYVIIFHKHFFKRMKSFEDRGIKEANYTEIKKTKMPAILFEGLFFTNRTEAEYLLSEEGQDNIASAIFDGIKEIEYGNTSSNIDCNCNCHS